MSVYKNTNIYLNIWIKLYTHTHTHTHTSFPGGSDGKESVCNAGDLGSVPGLRRSPGEGNGYPLHYSGLENSMDRGAWQARDPWDLKESDMTEWLPEHSLNLEASLVAEMVKSPLACNAGDLGSILGSGRSPGGGHGNPFQYSCMENPMDRVCIHTYIHIYIYQHQRWELTLLRYLH